MLAHGGLFLTLLNLRVAKTGDLLSLSSAFTSVLNVCWMRNNAMSQRSWMNWWWEAWKHWFWYEEPACVCETAKERKWKSLISSQPRRIHVGFATYTANKGWEEPASINRKQPSRSTTPRRFSSQMTNPRESRCWERPKSLSFSVWIKRVSALLLPIPIVYITGTCLLESLSESMSKTLSCIPLGRGHACSTSSGSICQLFCLYCKLAELSHLLV